MLEINKTENITVIEVMKQEDDYFKSRLEVITEHGTTQRQKALIVSDDEYNNELTVLILNLSLEEREKLFNTLDSTLHKKVDTRAYMQDRIQELENRNSIIEDVIAVEEYKTAI